MTGIYGRDGLSECSFPNSPHRGDDNDRTELAQTLHLKSGACRLVQENQPFYKKRIPAVNNHFAKMYNLK